MYIYTYVNVCIFIYIFIHIFTYTCIIEPVTDTIEAIYDCMISSTPVIFLLSIGADPTESIEGLARKRKLPGPSVISMGEVTCIYLYMS
jgi:hypothetical protein